MKSMPNFYQPEIWADHSPLHISCVPTLRGQGLPFIPLHHRCSRIDSEKGLTKRTSSGASPLTAVRQFPSWQISHTMRGNSAIERLGIFLTVFRGYEKLNTLFTDNHRIKQTVLS